MPEVDTLSTQVGGDAGHNTGNIGIGLVPRHARKHSQMQVEDEIRKRLEGVPGIDVALGDQPIYIALLGPDPTVLDTITSDLAAKIAQDQGHHRPHHLGQARPARVRGARCAPTPRASWA